MALSNHQNSGLKKQMRLESSPNRDGMEVAPLPIEILPLNSVHG